MTDPLATPIQTPTTAAGGAAPARGADDTPVVLSGDVVPVVPVTVPATVPVVADTPVEFTPTGDVGLDMALSFIGKQGYGPEHPAVIAATTGNFSLLAAELAAKGVAGADQYIKLGEKAFADITAKDAARAEADKAAIYAAAGGPDEWKAIQAWASASATPEEKASINASLKQGGFAAKTAVVYLAGAYAKANVSQEPASAVKPGASAAPAAATPMTASQYQKEVQALNIKLRGRIDGSPEYAALQAKRAAAIR